MYYFDNGSETMMTEVRDFSFNGYQTAYIGTPQMVFNQCNTASVAADQIVVAYQQAYWSLPQ